MNQRGNMPPAGTSGEGRAGLSRRIEWLQYANKALLHELAAIKLERARVQAELELSERRAAGLERVCSTDASIAAEQRALANRLQRRLTRTRRLAAAGGLLGAALALHGMMRR